MGRCDNAPKIRFLVGILSARWGDTKMCQKIIFLAEILAARWGDAKMLFKTFLTQYILAARWRVSGPALSQPLQRCCRQAFQERHKILTEKIYLIFFWGGGGGGIFEICCKIFSFDALNNDKYFLQMCRYSSFFRSEL